LPEAELFPSIMSHTLH